jgi:iron complex outermembrane receptor protein
VLATAIGTILAGAAWGQQGQIETVIVTAEFRETDVQDTPVAITAISGEMLDARAQSNVFQVAAQAPNVSLTPGGQGRSGMMASIRGIGQIDFIAALEPGVGIYVDDVYYPQLTGSLLDLLDLDRVEILRGPQGTLAGRNSIGGAIRLYSKQAGSDEGGRVSVGYGSFDQVDVRGMADIELSPGTLYARFAGASRARNGYIDVIDYECSHPGSGVYTNATGRRDCKLDEWGDQAYVTGRANLRWTPSDRLGIDFIADFLNDSSGTAASTLLYADRTAIEASPLQPSLSIDDGDPGTPLVYFRDHIFVPHGPYRNPNDPINDPYVNYATLTDPYTTMPIAGGDTLAGTTGVPVNWKPLSLPSRNTLDHRGLSLNLTWDITDRLSLTSISAYREYETWMTWDSDLSPIPVTMLDNTLTHDQRSQELRLSGALDAVDYTVGAFYFDQYTDYTARVNLNYALIDFVHGPDPTPASTWAVFGNATWHLTDRLNVSAGVRYSDELKDYTHRRHNPDYSDVAGSPADPGFPINVRVSNLDGATARFEDTRSDWRVAVDYGVGDSAMVYASAATGYKSGGVNPRPFFIEQLNVFNPETMVSYEFGFKSTLADNTVRLNAAVFTTDYEDIQLTLVECEVPPFIDPDGIAAPCAKPANVGNADVSGIELELEWFATENLLVDGSISTIDFEYASVDAAALTGSPIAPLDMITPYTPELKWAVGVQYGVDLDSGGRFNIRLDTSFQDEVYTSATNDPLNLIEDYTLSNAKLWWQSADDEWDLGLEIRNLTDKLYYHSLFDQHLSVGQVQAQPAMPRTWLVSATRRF